MTSTKYQKQKSSLQMCYRSIVNVRLSTVIDEIDIYIIYK